MMAANGCGDACSQEERLYKYYRVKEATAMFYSPWIAWAGALRVFRNVRSIELRWPRFGEPSECFSTAPLLHCSTGIGLPLGVLADDSSKFYLIFVLAPSIQDTSES